MKRERRCQCCGQTFLAARTSALFCSPACRVRAHRGQGDRAKVIVSGLAVLGMIGKLWPVYRTDKSPPVFGSMVPRSATVAEYNLAHPDEPISNAELAAALRDRRVLDWGAPIPALALQKAHPRPGHHPSALSNAKRRISSTISMIENSRTGDSRSAEISIVERMPERSRGAP